MHAECTRCNPIHRAPHAWQKVAKAMELTPGSTFDDYRRINSSLVGQKPGSRTWLTIQHKLRGTPFEAGSEYANSPDGGLALLIPLLKEAAICLKVAARGVDGSAVAPVKPPKAAKVARSGGKKQSAASSRK
jgi:hypothetical protein